MMNLVFKTKEDYNKAKAMCLLMGINFEEAEETKTTASQPKADKPAKKTTSKKSDDFDRKKYEELSREFGCWSERKHTCYKKCRDTLYSVMDGTLTKAKGKAEVKKILKAEYNIG